MHNLIVTIFLFAAGTANAEDFAAESRETIACTSNDECIIVEGVCRDWMAINRKYESSNSEKIAKIRPLVECDAVTSRPRPVAQCSDNACEIKE